MHRKETDMAQATFERVEKKYLLNEVQYRKLRRMLTPYITADPYPEYTITNIYFDTDNFQLIRTSLDKPMYKEKLRLRASCSFFLQKHSQSSRLPRSASRNMVCIIKRLFLKRQHEKRNRRYFSSREICHANPIKLKSDMRDALIGLNQLLKIPALN